MHEKGGLVSDFISETKIDRQNFLRRNRIIAGLADATIIVESAEKGGALVTADIANSYNRDVFAFPGRSTDVYSRGCNKIIKLNEAVLVETQADIEKAMNWDIKVSTTHAYRVTNTHRNRCHNYTRTGNRTQSRSIGRQEIPQTVHKALLPHKKLPQSYFCSARSRSC